MRSPSLLVDESSFSENEIEMEKPFISLKDLFLSLFKIASLTLGGGAVMLPLMEEEFCHRRKLFTKKEMVDILSLVNSLPGVIGLNSSLIIGRKLRGWRGALVAALALLLPSFIIILLLSEFVMYARKWPFTASAFLGVRAGATGLILLMLLRLFKKSLRGWREIFIAVTTVFELRILGLYPWQVVILAAILGLFLFREEDTL